MKKVRPVVVMCLDCKLVVGTVAEVSDPNRAGFYSNVCTPNPMPVKCEVCAGALTRVAQHTFHNDEIKFTRFLNALDDPRDPIGQVRTLFAEPRLFDKTV